MDFFPLSFHSNEHLNNTEILHCTSLIVPEKKKNYKTSVLYYKDKSFYLYILCIYLILNCIS